MSERALLMTIEFACPNGHKLSCPDERAGRTAKCPKCQTPVKIPESIAPPTSNVADARQQSPAPGSSLSFLGPMGTGSGPGAGQVETSYAFFDEHAEGAAPVESGSKKSDPKLTGAAPVPSGSQIGSPTPGASVAAQAPERQIVFLCPNGHKLNGPARMAGRLGQCPHCGAKFQIPTLEQMTAIDTNEAAEEIEATPTGDNGAGAEFWPGEEPSNAESADGEPELAELIYSVETGQAGVRESGEELADDAPYYADPDMADQDLHPLARLVMRLWEEREHGGIVELHLNGGVMIVPEWFEKQLSRQSHGLFATQAADGTVTMTAVPWDSVARVVIRGVVGLPDGMFE